jgi:hypothetical protein
VHTERGVVDARVSLVGGHVRLVLEARLEKLGKGEGDGGQDYGNKELKGAFTQSDSGILLSNDRKIKGIHLVKFCIEVLIVPFD